MSEKKTSAASEAKKRAARPKGERAAVKKAAGSAKTATAKKTAVRSASAPRKTSRRTSAPRVLENPVAAAAGRKSSPVYDEYDIPGDAYDELDMAPVAAPKPKKKASGSSARRSAAKKTPPADAYDELDLPAPRPRKAQGGRKKPAVPVDVDPYDLEPEDVPRRPRNRRRGPKLVGHWLTVLLFVAVVAWLALIGRQFQQYNRFTEMRAAVERQTFYDGTMVDGIDVSGLTLQEAQARWADEIEPGYAGRTVTFTNGEGRSVTAAELGYSSNYLNVLAAAWDAGRSGTLEQRYDDISTRSGAPVSYEVSRSFYDRTKVESYAAAAARALDREPTEPHITAMDMNTYEFTFAEGDPGQVLDQWKMADDICATLDTGSGSVTLALREVPPTRTVADVKDNYGLVAQAETSASSSSSARLNNIRLALSTINGTSLAPGETFSFNGTVGQRTTERGYQPAGAYNAGEVVQEVGGGICQVSTTLFNAVVKADLEITERHNHTMPVGYVDKGKDATVNWGQQDFRFTNNTDSEIYIVAALTSDKHVHIAIFGRQLPDGQYITVEAVTTEKLDFEVVYQLNPDLPRGAQNVVQQGRTGYRAEAYKIVWDKDGNQLSKTLLCKSLYSARNTLVEVGPQ